MCRRKGVSVLSMPARSGPAAARNAGARAARGDILFFVDADVEVQPCSVSRVVSAFKQGPDVAAVFGSYDDRPPEKNFVSQYKNLFHHFVHQHSSTDAVSFWAGCGAIRRPAFEAVGGFDQEKFSEPSIEDIELGYRLSARGFRITLDKSLQVTHLKRWTLGSLLRADIFRRAWPWSKLTLERRKMINDLNLRRSHKLSAVLVGLELALLPLAFFEPALFFAAFLVFASVIVINRRLYGFFLRHRGWRFAALAFPLHALYYVYCGATFVTCWALFVLRRKGTAA
jgi:GT2 family glycosyltransferase